jgi:hypothetical protein
VSILFITEVSCFYFCPSGMHKPGRRVADLIELTANVVTGGVVALMLMAVQKDGLELSIKQAVKWYVLCMRGWNTRGNQT